MSHSFFVRRWASPNPALPAPHRPSTGPGLRGCPAPVACSAGAARRTAPWALGKLQAHVSPGAGRGEADNGAAGEGDPRGGGGRVGGARGDRVAGLEFGSHPGESRVPPLDNRASRGPARAGLHFHESPGRREGPRAAPRRGFARKSQRLPPGDDTEARFGSLTGPVVLGCAIFRFCPWPFKQLSAPPGTL